MTASARGGGRPLLPRRRRAGSPPRSRPTWPRRLRASRRLARLAAWSCRTPGTSTPGRPPAVAYRLLPAPLGGGGRVVLLGPAHYVAGRGVAVVRADAWATPLGDVAVDAAARAALMARAEATVAPLDVRLDDAPHAPEHSLEVHCRSSRPPCRMCPCCRCWWAAETPTHRRPAGAVVGRPATLFVVSTDLSHYEPAAAARRHDARTADAICRLDADGDRRPGRLRRRPLRAVLHLAARPARRCACSTCAPRPTPPATPRASSATAPSRSKRDGSPGRRRTGPKASAAAGRAPQPGPDGAEEVTVRVASPRDASSTRAAGRLTAADVVRSFDGPAGAYVHVPFCEWICPFCPYNKVRADGTSPSGTSLRCDREVDAYVERRRPGARRSPRSTWAAGRRRSIPTRWRTCSADPGLRGAGHRGAAEPRDGRSAGPLARHGLHGREHRGPVVP